MLPPERIEAYGSMSGLAMVEIAGRDSVAAAVKAVEEDGFTDLLPSYVYTATEHGAWSSVEDAVKRLAGRLPHIQVHPILAMGSPRFWQALNGRYVNELIGRFGFLCSCIGCHLYLHSVRIPLAVRLGKIPIISGERERHDGVIKINQIGEALTRYQDLAMSFGVRLLFPLQHISDGQQIDEILGFAWEEGKEQMGCVLSGNYRGTDGSVRVTVKQAVQYLDTFANPVTLQIIKAYLKGQVPDHLKIAARVLGP